MILKYPYNPMQDKYANMKKTNIVPKQEIQNKYHIKIGN
jgi:hypothetical protein